MIRNAQYDTYKSMSKSMGDCAVLHSEAARIHTMRHKDGKAVLHYE